MVVIHNQFSNIWILSVILAIIVDRKISRTLPFEGVKTQQVDVVDVAVS